MKAKVKFYGIIILGFLLALLILTPSCEEDSPFEAPLFDNLGDYQVVITSKSKVARSFFNQGLILANGFALNGLYHSLLGQGKLDEAKSVKRAFEKSWQYADTWLKYSRVDPEKRENLVLKLDKNSASDLSYIASSFCGL